MGGLAIKNAFTRRYQKDEFDAVLPTIIEKAKKLFSDAKSTTYFKSKESFGDADILCLVDKPMDNIDIKQWIIDEFQSKEVVQNSHVYSFEYNELQVDFILTPKADWETSQIYFSYNDLHNLVGKVAHKFGLKWGYKGLVYPYRIDGKMMSDIVVTKDYRKALNFLGFSAHIYDQGFDSIDEIFLFVTSSTYFNPWMFDFETLNRINRDRDKKRKTYAGFVEHVAPMKARGKEAFWYFYSDKTAYLGLIDHYFPGFLKNYRALQKKEERKREVNSFYNGNIIMENFGLKGADLGKVIGGFEKHFGSKEALEDYVLSTKNTEIIMQKFAMVNDLPKPELKTELFCEGLKREGASCSKNNNCTYPDCLTLKVEENDTN